MILGITKVALQLLLERVRTSVSIYQPMHMLLMAQVTADSTRLAHLSIMVRSLVPILITAPLLLLNTHHMAVAVQAITRLARSRLARDIILRIALCQNIHHMDLLEVGITKTRTTETGAMVVITEQVFLPYRIIVPEPQVVDITR